MICVSLVFYFNYKPCYSTHIVVHSTSFAITICTLMDGILYLVQGSIGWFIYLLQNLCWHIIILVFLKGDCYVVCYNDHKDTLCVTWSVRTWFCITHDEEQRISYASSFFPFWLTTIIVQVLIGHVMVQCVSMVDFTSVWST